MGYELLNICKTGISVKLKYDVLFIWWGIFGVVQHIGYVDLQIFSVLKTLFNEKFFDEYNKLDVLFCKAAKDTDSKIGTLKKHDKMHKIKIQIQNTFFTRNRLQHSGTDSHLTSISLNRSMYLLNWPVSI